MPEPGSVPAGPTLSERLGQLLDRLNIDTAHFCARAPKDVLSLVAADPRRVASITLVGGNEDPSSFRTVASRMLWLSGDSGSIGRSMRPRLAALREGKVHWLEGYEEFMWSDTVADRTDEVAEAVLPFLEESEHRFPVSPVHLAHQGEVAGITYEVAGDGTPVVLLPLGLSARQWGPLLPYLQKRHCTIVLGGPHLQPVENLESRGAGRYADMALDVLRLAQPRLGESLIEIGCGSGALLRRIVRDLGMPSVVGLDVNTFLLKEALALARREGLDSRLALHEGSAEAIPFPEASFDVVFSSTVMEEVDADRMVAELVRIARPGGRVAVIVRAVDRGTWTNVPLSETLKEKIEDSGSGGVAPRGCADATLYRRLQEAGLTGVRGGPAWAWVGPDEPWWDNVGRQIRGALISEEAEAWDKAVAGAQRDELPIWLARPFHCAVGTKR